MTGLGSIVAGVRTPRRVRWGLAGGVVTLVVVGVLAATWIDYRGVLHMRRAARVRIDAQGATLAADLIVPRRGAPPYPAAVVVHGSGRITRAELHEWARTIAPAGIAVLIYDKRGTGESTGAYPGFGMASSARSVGELAGDAAAAFEWLRAHPDVDAARVGFIGGSQAGWVMPVAAQRVESAAFIVGISGPAVTAGEEDYYSKLTGDDPGPYVGLANDEIARRLAAFEGPHGYDPDHTLRALEVPTLWVLGGADRSVPTELSVRRLNEIRASGNTAHEVIVHPNGDHNLRDSNTGRRIDYWPEVFEWLRGRSGASPGRRGSKASCVSEKAYGALVTSFSAMRSREGTRTSDARPTRAIPRMMR